MGNKILLVGGSRDGEWINDPGLPRYHVILQDPPLICKSTYPPTYDPPNVEVYKRKEWHFREGQELEIYVLDGTEDYDLYDLLLRNYNPNPTKPIEPPELEPEDPEVSKRKQEDAAAAMAWNNFIGKRLE